MVRRSGHLQRLGEPLAQRGVRDLLREALRESQARPRRFSLWDVSQRQSNSRPPESNECDGAPRFQNARRAIQLSGISEGRLDFAHVAQRSRRRTLPEREQDLSAEASVWECNERGPEGGF